MRLLGMLLILSAVPTAPVVADSLQFAHEVPLARSAAGTLAVDARIGDVQARFLLDTGAGMVAINRELFERLQTAGTVRAVRRAAVRLADNGVKAVDVYRVERLQLGERCEVGPLEVVVLGRGGRNLLGLNALQQAAPFAVDTGAPSILLSRCLNGHNVAALR